MKCFIFVSLLLLFQNNAVAKVKFTARDLISLCSPIPGQSKELMEQGENNCLLYMAGLRDGLFMMQMFREYSMSPCMPSGEALDVSETRRLFENYLAKHRDALENSAGLVAANAVAEAYQCAKSK